MYRRLWHDLASWLRTESRRSPSHEASLVFLRVSERMAEEMSRLKEHKKRSQHEDGKENTSARAVRVRPVPVRCLYGIGDGDSQGSFGFGSEGGAR